MNIRLSHVLNTHIRLDDQGVAWIAERNVKVVEVALDKVAHGLSAEEIFEQHGKYLSMAQIHAALMYYYDHQTEFDATIDQQLARAAERRAATLDSPGRRRLRELGKLE